MDISHIAPETLSYEILPYLSNADLGSLSRVNSYYYQLCRDENLWKSRILKDYPLYINFKPVDTTYRDYYIFLTTSPKIPIYRNNEIVTSIPPFPMNTIDYLSQSHKCQADDVILYATPNFTLTALNIDGFYIYKNIYPAYIFIISRQIYNDFSHQLIKGIITPELILSIPTKYPIYLFFLPYLPHPIFTINNTRIEKPSQYELGRMLYLLDYPLPPHPQVSQEDMLIILLQPRAFFMYPQEIYYHYVVKTYYTKDQVETIVINHLKSIGHYFDLRCGYSTTYN